MARRKNKRKRAVGFTAPFRILGFVPVVVVAFLGYVWLGNQITQLGRELKGLEVEQSGLSKKYLNEEYRWTRLKSPRNIEVMLRKHGIRMDWPRSDQVVRLSDASRTMEQWAHVEATAFKYAKLEKVVLNE